MSFPKITELPNISESDSISLQAIIGTKKISDWKELYKKAVFDLLGAIRISNSTYNTL